MDFSWVDALKGIGSLASAWGTYTTGKEQSKIEKDKLAYEKNKDTLAAQQTALAQSNLDSALTDVYGNKKKKKTTTIDITDAYTPVVG